MIDFEKGYEEFMKKDRLKQQKKASPVHGHSSLKLALSGRYTDGTPISSSDDDEDNDATNSLNKRQRRKKEQEEPEEAPAFLLLESCWNKIDKARTQSRKLRYDTIHTARSNYDLRPEERYEYSSNTDHDYDGISTTTGEYNNDTFYFKDVSMESTIKDEAKATAIFQDFNNDVDKWKLKYPTGTSTREEQSRYASYLSEHYLASRLDPLAGTTEVRRIRREIAKRIQLIENYGDDTVAVVSPLGIRNNQYGVGNSSSNNNNSNNTKINIDENAGTSVMEDMTNTVQQQESKDLKPWRCKICTKSNKHDCLKCIICGREKTADAIKTRAFIKAVPKHSVADRKGKAVLNAMSSSNDVGSYYSERKYIRQIPTVNNKKGVNDNDPKTGGNKKGKKPPATWGGRHSASLTSLPEHSVKSVGIGRPIGHL